MFWFMQDDLRAFLAWVIAVTLHLTIHEFAHAKRAQIAGDDTPELNNRVTLNPLAHYDLIGTTMLLLFRMGWGKPVPTNPFNYRRPRYDDIMVSAWGGFANLIGASVIGLTWRLLMAYHVGEPYYVVFQACVRCGLVLAFFNYIPIYPLDGSHILLGLLPTEKARRLEAWYSRFGMIALLAIIMLPFGHPIAWLIIQYPIKWVFWLLTGLPIGFF